MTAELLRKIQHVLDRRITNEKQVVVYLMVIANVKFLDG